jgi:integrase
MAPAWLTPPEAVTLDTTEVPRVNEVSQVPPTRKPRVRETVGKNLYRHIASGRYEIGYRDPATGRWIMKRLEARNVTEAKRHVREILGKVETGEIKAADRSVTLRELADAYLAHERGAAGTLAERTVDLYQQRIEDHALRLLGGRTRVADLTVVHLRRNLIDRMKHEKKGGSTIRGTVAALSGALRFAVRNGTITRSPLRDLERGDLPSAKRQSEPRYLTIEQVRALLDRMSDESRPVAATLFYGALRVSEALALVWSDIDFDTATITVSGTKTKASRATVPLLPALGRELRAHRVRASAKGLPFVQPNALVFQTRNGKSPGRRNILRAVQTAAKAVGLNPKGAQPVGLHDLRHSAAGLAFESLALNEVSRLLRHANPRVTTTVYGGINDDAAQAIGEKLANAGFGA